MGNDFNQNQDQKSGVQRIKIINKRQHACKMDRHDYQTTECSCG